MKKENQIETKHRHWSVTACLVLIIVTNSLLSQVYLFASDIVGYNLPPDVSYVWIKALGVLGLANIFFAVLLFRWRKIGFWGFVLASIGSLLISLYLGLMKAPSLLGLLGILVLYGVLQIKKDGVSTWENLN